MPEYWILEKDILKEWEYAFFKNELKLETPIRKMAKEIVWTNTFCYTNTFFISSVTSLEINFLSQSEFLNVKYFKICPNYR